MESSAQEGHETVEVDPKQATKIAKELNTFPMGNCFTLRAVKCWPRLTREVVDAPSLDTFQVVLDRALSSLIQLKMSLFIEGPLDYL